MKTIISYDDFDLLMRVFSRHVVENHERDKNSTCTMGYESYWLRDDLCRRPHHPPRLILKYRPTETKTGHPIFIIYEDCKSKEGMEYTAIMAYQARNPKISHRLAVASIMHHHTGGASGGSVVVEPNTATIQKYGTGGTGHGQDLYLIWGLGSEKIIVNTWYRSMRGRNCWNKNVNLEYGEFFEG